VTLNPADERLLSILETLEECRAALLIRGEPESARLVSAAILDIRMRVHHIGDDELKALCEEMLADDGTSRLRDAKVMPGRQRRPLLRVVK
jgi:hypothetical protein